MQKLRRTAGEQIVIDDKWVIDVDLLRREITDWLTDIEFDDYFNLQHIVKELKLVGADVSLLDDVDWICRVANDDDFDDAVHFNGIEPHELLKLVELGKVDVDLDYTKRWLAFGDGHKMWSLGSELDKMLADAADTAVNAIVDAARQGTEAFDKLYKHLYFIPVDTAFIERTKDGE